jgi:hypothetical protein
LQASIKKLEQEIIQLSKELDSSVLALEKSQKELTNVEEYVEGIQSYERTVSSLCEQKRLAESNQRAVTSISAIHCCQPISIKSASMSFSVAGKFPKTCVKVSCLITKDGRFILESTMQSDLFPRKSRMVKRGTKFVSPFIEACVAHVCSNFGGIHLEHLQHIGPYLNKLGWQLARIEDIAVEVDMVRQRYPCTLKANNVNGRNANFSLVVGFGTPTKLQATFDLSERLFVSRHPKLLYVDKTLNHQHVERVLKHSAWTGYGSLAHTCAIIAAMIDKKDLKVT